MTFADKKYARQKLFILWDKVVIVVKVSFKTIKIKDETYENINVFIGELRKELKRPVSVDEAIKRLLNFKKWMTRKLKNSKKN
jgi:hypothetical protein